MTTKFIVANPKPNNKGVMVQPVRMTGTNIMPDGPPIQIPEDETREFWVTKESSYLVTECEREAEAGGLNAGGVRVSQQIADEVAAVETKTAAKKR